MKSKFLNTVVPALFIFAAGAAQAKDSDLLSLSVEHFKDTATVTDTGPDAVTISTENGYKDGRGPMRTVWNDGWGIGPRISRSCVSASSATCSSD